MKGLLVKDFKLLKMQKNYFFIIVVIAIGMAASMKDITFIFSYLMFIISLFSLSTISYDEFDNGNAFLFTLPISRNDYVLEKYCFGSLLCFGSWVLAIILSMIVNIVNGANPISEEIVESLLFLAIMLILQSVMIPLQFKFGAEKSRIALIIIFGIVFLIGLGITKGLALLGIDITAILNNASTLNLGAVTTAAIVVIITVGAMLLSLKISTAIMNRKEF